MCRTRMNSPSSRLREIARSVWISSTCAPLSRQNRLPGVTSLRRKETHSATCPQTECTSNFSSTGPAWKPISRPAAWAWPVLRARGCCRRRIQPGLYMGLFIACNLLLDTWQPLLAAQGLQGHYNRPLCVSYTGNGYQPGKEDRETHETGKRE